MPNFTDVQFISWEIYTGPNRGPLPWGPINITPLGMSPPGASYTGIDKGDNQRLFPWIKMDPPLTESDNRLDVAAQILDIDARVSFTYEAIDQVVPYVDTRQTTLKLFMAPEFLYRGKGGAYVHDLINGWKGEAPAELGVSGASDFPGLFGRLRRRLFANVQSEFLDWLFVFGTAISASFPAKNENEKWVRDATKPGEIYNTALIQSGRNFDAVYASRKHYKSGIDFIQQYLGAKAFTDGDVVPADRADLEPNETNREGSAIFTMKEVNDKDGQPIKFGLEVCLDHATSTGSDGKPRNCGRICTANQSVKIQLVPSGGMSLQTASIRLLPSAGPTTRSYAFNCDGLTSLQSSEKRFGGHTQIWNGVENQLVNADLFQRFQRYYVSGETAPSWNRNSTVKAVLAVPCQTSLPFIAPVRSSTLGPGCWMRPHNAATAAVAQPVP